MATYTFNTLGDVVDEAYDILAVDGDSNTFPGLSRTNFNKFANRFNKEFVDSVRLRTQEATSTFTLVADTTTSAAHTSGATTFTITDATGWPSSGLAIIDDVPMTFTRSSTTLTVSATTRNFDSGVVVQLCYAVPSDYWRTQSLFVDSTQFGYTRRGDYSTLPMNRFALYGDFFVFPKDTAGTQIVLNNYYKKPTQTMATGDTMDIMEMWDQFIIFKLVAHGLKILLDNERAVDFEGQAELIKKKARSHFAKLDGSLGMAFIPATF